MRTAQPHLLLALIAGLLLAPSSSAANYLFHLSEESVHPDHVLQPGETVTLSFSVSELGQPLEDVTWSVAGTDGAPVAITPSSGTLDQIPAGEQPVTFLELSLTAEGVDPFPARTLLTLTLSGDGGSASYSFHLSLGKAEVLLISDGMPGVRETLGPALEDAEVVWGFAGIPIRDLPDSMFGAYVIMIEADGRFSEDLFTDADPPVRDWFRYGRGGGSISGLYLHETYPNADPQWLGGIGGEWPDPAPSSVFNGLPDDEIARGETAEAVSSEGISICYPCCGNPANFHTPGGDAVAGWVDYGWRIVNYGFSLVHLDNDPAVELTRDELIDRTANWMLYRDATVSDPVADPAPLPGDLLLRAWPNPFNARLTVELNPRRRAATEIHILNALGRHVATLHPEPGANRVSWDASGQPSGLYLLRAINGQRSETRRVTLVK